MQKAKHSAATELGEEPNASRKRRRHDGLDLGLFERDREKRNRTVVNYAEKQNASGGGLRTSDVILACLDVHARSRRHCYLVHSNAGGRLGSIDDHGDTSGIGHLCAVSRPSAFAAWLVRPIAQ